ncbi:exodeoxyribonuclease V subunit alpha [Acinetobacter baumannii]|uniref:exodeoxyribonuclease V subunit alpha n=1 Tax=Acinetobacter baumannii TaxID=470 RepID=UPI0008DE095B|nr:exodeoxyribonuclease V subunit alpha [Acinetobacter baumannii]OIH12129.1 exodeoxyribonuclease V subunit alpha [Acinetobacter baumannii]
MNDENIFKEIWVNEIIKCLNTDERLIVSQPIMNLLNAIDRGDSCITIDGNIIKSFGVLLSYDAKSSIFKAEQSKLFLNRHYSLEKRLAEEIKRIVNSKNSITINSDKYENLLNDPYQKQALLTSLNSKISLIIGGAGTGKTYTLARIVSAINDSMVGLNIAFAAPTGKAAQRMQEALKKAFSDEVLSEYLKGDLLNANPITIHRLIGLSESGKAQYGKNRKLPHDVIIIDESSMIDLSVAVNLFEAIKDSAIVIMLGDANQLPSVSVGNVFSDIQRTKLLSPSVVELKNSRRFLQDAKIGRLANYIQENTTKRTVIDFENNIVANSNLRNIELNSIQDDFIQFKLINNNFDEKDLDIIVSGFNEFFSKIASYKQNPTINQVYEISKSFETYRILTSIKNGKFGSNTINRYILEKIGKFENTDFIGKAILISENNYSLGLSNGDIGICVYSPDLNGELSYYFPSLDKYIASSLIPYNTNLAYAMTIHKSQGSEFDHVAIIIDDDERMLNKQLFYTAVTRAKKVISLIATESALESCINNNSIRQSGLVEKIDC